MKESRSIVSNESNESNRVIPIVVPIGGLAVKLMRPALLQLCGSVPDSLVNIVRKIHLKSLSFSLLFIVLNKGPRDPSASCQVVVQYRTEAAAVESEEESLPIPLLCSIDRARHPTNIGETKRNKIGFCYCFKFNAGNGTGLAATRTIPPRNEWCVGY
jgi:hypothetical protein